MRSRRRSIPGVVLSLLVLQACGGSPPPEYRPTATVKDIMDSLVDPQADVLWESVATEVSTAGTVERMPRTDDEWKNLRRSAISIVEATNLLMMPGRRVAGPGEKSENPGIELPPEAIADRIRSDPAKFMLLAHGLHDAASEALRAIDARSVPRLFDAGEHIDQACENCHQVYWYPPDAAREAPSVRK